MPTPLLDYLREHASRIRHVLVDVFDTIVLRRVEPEHVKRIAARRLRDLYGTALSAAEIYTVRARLETSLCERNARLNGDLEFRLGDLLRQLRLELQQRDWSAFVHVDEAAFVQTAARIETEIEQLVQYTDVDVVEFLRELGHRNIPATAVTDTYLPRQVIEMLLEHHGVLPYLRSVVVSNDTMETKRSGRLYDRVLAQIDCPPEAVLMVGDNEHSDVQQAASRKIATCLLDRTATRRQYQQFREVHANPRRLEDELAACLAGDMPFAEMACSLYAFTTRLHTLLHSRGARDVFFLSREGEFLRELFDQYQAINGYGPDSLFHVRSHYLVVSRKSTFIPSLSALDGEIFETLFRQYRRLTLFEFLHSLNFPDPDIEAVARGLGVDPRVVEEDFPTSSTFARLKQTDAFRTRYEQIHAEQKDNFLRYMASFDAAPDDRLHLVDIGWKGTIQDHIFRIYGGTRAICGCYLGLVDYADASPLNQKNAVLFDTIRPRGRYDLIYNANRAIFEVFTGASHGSARLYDSAGGTITAVTDDNRAETHLYNTVIRPLQQHLRDRFERIARLMSACSFEIDCFDRWLARAHFRLVYRPSSQELRFFRSLYHFENFGFLARTTFDRGSDLGPLQRLRNAWGFLRDPSGVLGRGWWAPLTLDNLGLGFLAPLYGRWMERRYFRQAGGHDRRIRRHHEAMILELKDGASRQARMIAERDNYIKQLEHLAGERYTIMEQQTAAIAERDALIAGLREQVQHDLDGGATRTAGRGNES